jgi:hypothetical protein
MTTKSIINQTKGRFEGESIAENNLKLLEVANQELYLTIKENIDDSVDPKHSTYRLIRKADSVLTYFDFVLSNENECKKFSIVKLKEIIKNDIEIKDFLEIASNIVVEQNTIIENKLFVNICKNMIINRYLKKYQKSSLLVNKAKCIMVADKDTVKFGDDYKGQIYFTITDLTIREKIEMDNGLKFKDGCYTEKATQKGLNKRNGIYKWYNGPITEIFPIEFSFYVK